MNGWRCYKRANDMDYSNTGWPCVSPYDTQQALIVHFRFSLEVEKTRFLDPVILAQNDISKDIKSVDLHISSVTWWTCNLQPRQLFRKPTSSLRSLSTTIESEDFDPPIDFISLIHLSESYRIISSQSRNLGFDAELSTKLSTFGLLLSPFRG